MTKTTINSTVTLHLFKSLCAVLFAALFGAALCMALTLPGFAYAEPAQEEQVGFEREYLLLDCTSNLYKNSAEPTDGRYMLLCNDGTGIFVPDYAVYQITDWNTGDGKFFATTSTGEDIEGTIGNDNVVTINWSGATMKFLAQEGLPPTAGLSPDTWYVSLPYVFDEAGILTPEQLSELEARAEALTEKYSCDVRLVIVGDMADYSEWGNMGQIDTFAEEIAQSYNLGYGEDRDMIVLFMSMADRDFSLISYGPFGKEEVFDKYTREKVADAFIPAFKEDNWYAGFNDYFDIVEKALVCNETGVPIERPAAPIHIIVSLLFSLLIGFVIAYFVSTIVRKKSKTVKGASSASGYTVPNGSEITHREDNFSHRSRSTVYSPLPKKDDSSSSGYSSYDSGGGFGHTSGKF